MILDFKEREKKMFNDDKKLSKISYNFVCVFSFSSFKSFERIECKRS